MRASRDIRRRASFQLIALPIFLFCVGGGIELDPEERGASPDESWECDGPRPELSLAGRARPLGGRFAIDLEFVNGGDAPVTLLRLGVGGHYEWGNDPNEPDPVRSSVRAPEGWIGRFGRQFEGVMIKVSWARKDRNDVAPGGRLVGLGFETKDRRLPPAELPFEVHALGRGCLWNRWTLEVLDEDGEVVGAP